jgi:UDP-glucose 4-epimerase
MSATETVVVTGGAGFIGSHVVDRLLAAGCNVIVVDNFSTGKRGNLPVDDRLAVVEADVVDGLWSCLRAAVRRLGNATRIVHLAAQTSVVRSIECPVLDMRINYGGSLQAFDYARHMGVKHVVFASSAAVYGDVATTPVHEDDSTRPLSPYGLHKLASEQCLRYHADVHGLGATAFRFFNVYGPRQDPGSPYSGVISIFMSRATRGQPLTIFGSGEQTRDFVYVGDIAAAVVTACLQAKPGFSVMNLGTGKETSVTDLARETMTLCQAEGEVEHAPAREGEILHSLASIELAHERLGFTPSVDLAQGLATTVRWYREQAPA